MLPDYHKKEERDQREEVEGHGVKSEAIFNSKQVIIMEQYSASANDRETVCYFFDIQESVNDQER